MRDFTALVSYRLRVSCAANLFVILLLSPPTVSAEPEPQILVDRQPPTVERVMFDPKNPPADMPKLHPGEAALCQFNFNCNVKLKYEVLDESGTGSTTSVSAHIRQVHVTLTLHDRIYVPRGGTPKIRAHEEGHRVINERVYEDAEAVARKAALEVLTQVWRGRGDSPDAAAKAATDLAVQHLCDEYLAGTAGKAAHVGEIFDELTKHGRNTRMTEADAIRRAFANYDSEQHIKPAAEGE